MLTKERRNYFLFSQTRNKNVPRLASETITPSKMRSIVVAKIKTVFFIKQPWKPKHSSSKANYLGGYDYKKHRRIFFACYWRHGGLNRDQSSWLKVETRKSGSCCFLCGLRKAGHARKTADGSLAPRGLNACSTRARTFPRISASGVSVVVNER